MDTTIQYDEDTDMLIIDCPTYKTVSYIVFSQIERFKKVGKPWVVNVHTTSYPLTKRLVSYGSYNNDIVMSTNNKRNNKSKFIRQFDMSDSDIKYIRNEWIQDLDDVPISFIPDMISSIDKRLDTKSYVSNDMKTWLHLTDFNPYANILYISSLYTPEKFRRQGYAEGLVYSVLSESSKTNSTSILAVNPENYAAISLYTKLGFIAIGYIHSVSAYEFQYE